MSNSATCSFCGQKSERVVEGPNGAYACWNCLLEAREVVAHLGKSYACTFCGESSAGNQVVEGPNKIHMCTACIESGIKLLNK